MLNFDFMLHASSLSNSDLLFATPISITLPIYPIKHPIYRFESKLLYLHSVEEPPKLPRVNYDAHVLFVANRLLN